MKVILLVVCIAVMDVKLKGQALFQDASGQSTLFMGKSKFAYGQFNTSSNSVSLGYADMRTVGFDIGRMRMTKGVDLKVSVNNGLGTVFSSSMFVPGFNADGYLGLFGQDKKGNYLSVYVKPTIAYSKYTFAYGVTGSPTVQTVDKFEGSGQVYLNYVIFGGDTSKSKLESFLFLGLSTGYQNTNNYNDLNDVQISTTQLSGNGILVAKTQTGKLGQYAGYNTLPLNIDVGYTPVLFDQNQVGFNFYERTNFFKANQTCNTGIGIYVTQKDHPNNIIGGLAWQLNDVFDQLNKPTNVFQRSSIFFYVGYSIGSNK